MRLEDTEYHFYTDSMEAMLQNGIIFSQEPSNPDAKGISSYAEVVAEFIKKTAIKLNIKAIRAKGDCGTVMVVLFLKGLEVKDTLEVIMNMATQQHLTYQWQEINLKANEDIDEYTFDVLMNDDNDTMYSVVIDSLDITEFYNSEEDLVYTLQAPIKHTVNHERTISVRKSVGNLAELKPLKGMEVNANDLIIEEKDIGYSIVLIGIQDSKRNKEIDLPDIPPFRLPFKEPDKAVTQAIKYLENHASNLFYTKEGREDPDTKPNTYGYATDISSLSMCYTSRRIIKDDIKRLLESAFGDKLEYSWDTIAGNEVALFYSAEDTLLYEVFIRSESVKIVVANIGSKEPDNSLRWIVRPTTVSKITAIEDPFK